ncbi:hypothetical protein QTP88_021730 [Uroleucon formosanum]
MDQRKTAFKLETYVIVAKIVQIICGILSIMNTVSFIFHLIVLEDILQVINILSTQLQQKTVTLGKASLVIEGVIKTFEEKCSDKCFSEV